MTSPARLLSAVTTLLLLVSACGSTPDSSDAKPAVPPSAASAPASDRPSVAPDSPGPSAGTAPAPTATTPAGAQTPKKAPKAPTTTSPRTTAPKASTPKPAATPTAGASGTRAETGIRSDVYAQHAATRRAHGLGALTTNSCLQGFADSHARRLASAGGGLSHQDLGPILRSCSMNLVGENVAAGQTSAAAAQSSWMNSSGHKSNILKPEHHRIGAAVHRAKDGRLYYVVVLGRG